MLEEQKIMKTSNLYRALVIGLLITSNVSFGNSNSQAMAIATGIICGTIQDKIPTPSIIPWVIKTTTTFGLLGVWTSCQIAQSMFWDQENMPEKVFSDSYLKSFITSYAVTNAFFWLLYQKDEARKAAIEQEKQEAKEKERLEKQEKDDAELSELQKQIISERLAIQQQVLADIVPIQQQLVAERMRLNQQVLTEALTAHGLATAERFAQIQKLNLAQQSITAPAIAPVEGQNPAPPAPGQIDPLTGAVVPPAEEPINPMVTIGRVFVATCFGVYLLALFKK